MRDLLVRLARFRVPLGFGLAAVVFLLASPTSASLLSGALIGTLGEAVRFWAAGHVEKGREVTSSGPYRWMRHPLYVGSTIIGIGLAVGCNSWPAALIILAYLGATLTAAARTEEASLRVRFGTAYDEYCAGRCTVRRRFSLARAVARNREHRTIGGLVLAVLLLALKMT